MPVYLGMCEGWVVFSASAANHFGECVDVAAHEFTHASPLILQGETYMRMHTVP